MKPDEWSVLVNSTMDTILQNPQEYLGEELPPPELTTETIHFVFQAFLQDIRIRDVQAFRKK
jgi:hypothetical protein